MRLFQICIFFIIIQISVNYNITQMKSNETVYKSGLSTSAGGYLYYLDKYSYSSSYDRDFSYFEFEIELDNKNDDKSISLAFVKDSYISSYYSSDFTINNKTISYSELDIQEKGEKKIIKWSKTFSFSNDHVGIFIIPDRQIGGFSIKLLKDSRANDLVTIIIFAVFFGICIFLCVLTLIMTKACGSKDSNDIIINKTKSTGLVQNELINGSQA